MVLIHAVFEGIDSMNVRSNDLKKKIQPWQDYSFFFLFFFSNSLFLWIWSSSLPEINFFLFKHQESLLSEGERPTHSAAFNPFTVFFFFPSPPRVCYYKMYNSIHVISGPHSRIVPSVVSCYVISSPSDCISLTVFAARLILPSLAWDIYRSNTTLSKARHSQKVREIGVISVCAFCLCVCQHVCVLRVWGLDT